MKSESVVVMTVEEDTFELWKEIDPVNAYAGGVEECAGMLFIPKPGNVEDIMKRIENVEAGGELEERLLKNFRSGLSHVEPPHIPSNALWALFYHMVIEGTAGEHITDLLERMKTLFESTGEIFPGEHPPEIRILAYLEARGLMELLNSLTRSNPFLKVMAEDVKGVCERFRERYRMVGVLEGTYEEIYPLLAEQEEHLKRDDYHEILRDLYGYTSPPSEIEVKALGWLKDEMKPFAEALQENAERLDAVPEVKSVEEGMTKIEGEKMGEFLLKAREVLLPVMRGRLIDIPESYRTDLIQTPEYLKPLIPTAAMTPMGMLKGEPRSLFFYTARENISLADTILSLVHEEYGHAVHYTLSALNPSGVSTLLERLNTSFSLPISEGISFHREVEFLELLRGIEDGRGGEEEGALREFFERHYPGGLKRAISEISYQVHKWRFIRFLRALGDVRINTGRQSVYEFVEWAHRYTALNRKDIFNQIFIFQEAPGYAPSYSLGEEAIVNIQKLGMDSGLTPKEVNTEIASRGFLPLDMFERWFEERYS